MSPTIRTVLHVANWYPNPWDELDGNFVRAQFELFREVTKARLVNVQVRSAPGAPMRFEAHDLGPSQRGYYILTRIRSVRAQTALSTLLLLCVLIRERAWRYDLLHFHIAWPLLAHAHAWKWLFRSKILISEHWSAYHFNFHLPVDAPAHIRMRRPFRQGFPVIAVSEALRDDIYRFAGTDHFPGYVIPNAVPLHGWTPAPDRTPVLFSVNRWVAIKDPMPMLSALSRVAEAGMAFQVVIGGYGVLLEEMRDFVSGSALAERTTFLGRMTKAQIAEQLARSDAYLFSSRYETFSVACAEALGAGVPLIGPFLAAIAEYAGSEDWVRVASRDAEGWSAAVTAFLSRRGAGTYHGEAIAERAARRFSPDEMKRLYAGVLQSITSARQATPAAAER